jgi:MFS family permease
MQPLFERIDNAKWTRPHWSVFFSLVIGFFMWGLIGALAPLFYPSVHAVWFLILPILAQVGGDLGLPRLSDLKLGRKVVFFLTLMLYGAGTILIAISVLFLSSNLVVIVIGIVLAYVGVEGEVPTGLSYAAEIFPLRLREKMLVLIPNFDNFGAMIAATIGFATYSLTNSSTVELEVLALFAIALLIVALGVRYAIPESVRWLTYKGKSEKAQSEVQKFSEIKPSSKSATRVSFNNKLGLMPRIGLLVVLGISQYLTYGLMTYIIADYYFSGNAVNFVVVVANAGAFAAGFVTLLIIRRLSVRSFSLFAYWGGALTMIPVFIVAYSVGSDLPLFYSLLFLNVAFSEFAWAVRGILEPILMPSRNRAFLVGVIRLGPMLAYAASIYLTTSFSLSQFVEYNFAVWVIGGVASIFWFFKGYNIEMMDLENASESGISPPVNEATAKDSTQ